MHLADIIPDCPDATAQTPISGFAIDHRAVTKGSVFGAFVGAKFNGEDYIAPAIAAGAVAIVARSQARVSGAAHIATPEPRLTFAQLAARFYAPFPHTNVAITGTNGKTSTAELTRQIWRLLGQKSASIGTLGVTTADDQAKTGLTTPDIITFLSSMHGLCVEGITHVAFEASSHGLSQFRSEGVVIKAAAFTNLSRDHLDYHGTMDDYFAAKMRLFSDVLPQDGTAVIWADDAYSDKVADVALARGCDVFTVGKKGADLTLIDATPSHLGQQISVLHKGRTYNFALPLIGAYQVNNVLTAAGLAIVTGNNADAVMAALTRVQGVRGRLERAGITQTGAPIYVDYAHTPDGLAAALSAMRPHTKGRLIAVFGAGGDRDTGKRPLMGAVAAAQADVVIITDDNPRTEDAASIRAEILSACPGATEICDRRQSIAAAIAMAAADDVILLAGKGHETGQIIGEHVLPFDDVAVAQMCLSEAGQL
jgi:UDP-N-acetylmuramoyl-L-alanyl-D-glutamate--2,6-diaminopimelate ligase